jgi:hypothetical protein
MNHNPAGIKARAAHSVEAKSGENNMRAQMPPMVFIATYREDSNVIESRLQRLVNDC